jgi:hypothetical protein
MLSSASKTIWNQYIENKDWVLLAKDTERLAESGRSPEAKIYWVLAQLRQEHLPKKLLFTPLIEAYRLTEDQETRSLALRVAEEIAKSGTVSLTPDERQMLLALGEEVFNPAKVQQDSPPTQDTKSKFELLSKSQRGNSSVKEQENSSSNDCLAATPITEVPPNKSSGSRGLLLFILISFFCLLVATITYLAYPLVKGLIFSGRDLSSFSLFDRSVFISANQLLSSTPLSLDAAPHKITKTSELDDLYYYEIGTKKKISNVVAGEVPTAGESVVSKTRVTSNDSTRQSPKVVVDTTGPVEPPLPPKVHSDSHPDGSDPLFGNGSPREWPRGTPPSRGELNRGTPTPHNDADPIEVEKFSTPRAYIAIYRTSILSKPSPYGYVNAEIYKGDKVMCDARFGNWLRVRAKSGNVGFVAIQDVAPSNR